MCAPLQLCVVVFALELAHLRALAGCAAPGIPALKIRDSVAEDQLVGGEGLVVCLRKDTGEEMVVPRDVLSHREELPPGGGVDDLTQLAFLNEASILDNLQERYTQGEDRARRPRIYTYCGRILLAANPFQPVCARDSLYLRMPNLLFVRNSRAHVADTCAACPRVTDA